LPGSIASIFFHTSSLSSVRIILPRLRKKQDVNTFQQM
jgi:hypothetical protein